MVKSFGMTTDFVDSIFVALSLFSEAIDVKFTNLLCCKAAIEIGVVLNDLTMVEIDGLGFMLAVIVEIGCTFEINALGLRLSSSSMLVDDCCFVSDLLFSWSFLFV